MGDVSEQQDYQDRDYRERDDTHALVLVDKIPHRLFPDMDAAREYVDDHDRMDMEEGNVSIFWPIKEDSYYDQ